jgi:hypothetical protein
MKISNRIVIKLFIIVSLLGLLIGCGFSMIPKDRMADSSADFNIVVEKAQNQMLLLNIVRASRRYPMYFTSFNALRGNMQYNFSTGNITIPFSPWPGYNQAYSVAPNAAYSSNPNFDLIVLDTQEFTNGIMTPVPMRTIDYYWNMGWPEELLLHLFIYRIDVKKPNGDWDNLYNYPPDIENFKTFQERLRLLKCKVKSEECAKLSTMTKQEARPKELIEAQKAGCEFIQVPAKDGGGYQLKSKKTEYTWKCEYKFTDDKGDKVDRTYKSKTACNHAGNKNEEENEEIKIYLRSPESIMYYLGEIVRIETKEANNIIPKIKICCDVNCKSQGEVPLFLVRKSTGTDSQASVIVEFEKIKYFIPRDPQFDERCRADQTMHVLSLVSQLIGQQKKVEQAPVTGVVNVIGR